MTHHRPPKVGGEGGGWEMQDTAGAPGEPRISPDPIAPGALDVPPPRTPDLPEPVPAEDTPRPAAEPAAGGEAAEPAKEAGATEDTAPSGDGSPTAPELPKPVPAEPSERADTAEPMAGADAEPAAAGPEDSAPPRTAAPEQSPASGAESAPGEATAPVLPEAPRAAAGAVIRSYARRGGELLVERVPALVEGMGAGPNGRRRPRRSVLVSVSVIAAVAVLTLVAVVHSPTAKAGSGKDVVPASEATSTTPGRAPSDTPTPTASSAAPRTTPPTTPAVALDPVKAVTKAMAHLGLHGRLSVAVARADGKGKVGYDSGSDTSYDTASIVKVDILASLLLRDQREGTDMTGHERQLATSMIEQSDNDAALALWQDIGRAQGLATGNKKLGLHHTTGGDGDLWGLTQTTAGDQIALLTAVFSSTSPLSKESRSYLSGLMSHVTDGQRWGVSAADTGAGSGELALKNGWLARSATGLWDINSIGIVSYQGHRLLVSVLSSQQSTEESGIAQVERVAQAAAKAYTEATGGS